MFEIHKIDGRNCPMITCDICGERLTEAGKAAVVFNNGAGNGAKLRTLQVHKGRIDGRTCHEEADNRFRAEGGMPGWEEMKTFLADAVHNIGFPPEELAEYDRRRSRFG